ncbi:max dimerization protein 1 isoform X2 [Daphnia magna]|uniref:Max dimerization protein 1 n=1 Tax=Daphnia magna TaxID=35525 RepID=A0A164VP50_9CRUS|nr:max dimerization protein 1 isoform X2 [Daphnia magna]KZS12515.1 Max dimerization protein 1 [Daphnia magna]
MSIDALLQAAEYLERREREAEHGYASSLPMPIEDYGSSPTPSGSSSSSATTSSTTRPIKIKKNQGSRSTHNELEKNRRAQLRTCLEKLKDLVPLGPESARHTTLGLLTRAKHFIKTLEERDRRHLQHKEQLNREQRFLRRKMEQLSQQFEQLSSSSPGASSQMNKRRGNSLSECSISTTISSASSLTSSVSSETDEVDVIGYGSHGSDLDDQLSVQSASSDSGIGLGNVASIGHFPHLSITDSV